MNVSLIPKSAILIAVFLVFIASNVSSQTVQQRLDTGESPKEIHDSGMLLDSLYGKMYQGGYIFYLNTTDGSGFVSDVSDHLSSQWGCEGTDIPGASGTGLGSGMQNTNEIVNGCNTETTAADQCVNGSNSGFSDWFLPSAEELNLMYINLKSKGYGSLGGGYYWSSTQVDISSATLQNFSTGTAYTNVKSGTFLVRAVRGFPATAGNQWPCVIADYPLDGDAVDTHGNMDGTPNGTGPQENRFGTAGAAMGFAGINDYVSIQDGLDNLPNGAISIWVYSHDLANDNPIISRAGMVTTVDMSLSINNGYPQFILSDQALVSNQQINDNEWHHIVCEWDGADMRMYIDANPVGTMPNIDGTAVIAGGEMRLGNSVDGSLYLNGRLDDFRVFDCSISETDIQGLYNENGWGTQSSCLVGDYLFEGNANNVLGGNDGTVTGASPQTDRFGNAGMALGLLGTDYISIMDGLNDFPMGSVSIWVYPNDLTNTNPIFTKPDDASGIDIDLSIVNGYPEFILAGQTITSNQPVNANEWHHIVCVWDGAEMRLYINNNHVGTMANNMGTVLVAGAEMNLGRSNDGSTHFMGTLDDLKIYNCAISEPDIDNLFHENGWGTMGGGSCLMADLQFNNNTVDETGNGHDANVVVTAPIATADRFMNNMSAYQFDGNNSKLEIPHHPDFNYNEVSYSVWFKSEDPSQDERVILSKDAAGNNPGELTMKVHAGNFVCSMEDGVSQYNFIVPINTEWNNVVFTSNGINDHRLYLNGSLVAAKNNMWTINGNNQPILIGGSSMGSLNVFNGIIDDINIFNCVIDPMKIFEIYHGGGWDIQEFQTECLDFNDNLVPENWAIIKGDTAFVGNGKFMTVYNGTDETAEMIRLGFVPENTDSVIIEWESLVTNAQPFHFTGLTLAFPDSNIIFVHMQSMNYDYGAVVVEANEENSDNGFLALDSSAISPGIYKNRLVCTNTDMYFTARKTSDPDFQPFEIQINPFDADPNYSLQHIGAIGLFQEASPAVGYNWMDNVCITLVESDPGNICEIAHYKFNGNLADNSGNGYHFMVENGPVNFVENRFGIQNKAIYLSEANQELNSNNSAPEITGDFALSTWVKPDPFSGSDTSIIFSNYDEGIDGNNMVLGILEATGKVFFGHVNPGGLLFIDQTDFSIPTSAWSHLVLMRDSVIQRYTLYYNSDSVRSFNYATHPTFDGLPSVLAVSSSESAFNYSGSIDGTIFWKCLITPGLIDTIYHIGGWPQVMCDDLAIMVNPSPATCGEDNGTATVSVANGSGFYNINWSIGDEGYSADSLSAGMHSVQVTDSIYGCMINQFFNINNSGAPTLSIDATHNSCYGDAMGSANVMMTGGTPPYIVEWSTGEATQLISNLESGNYFVTVVDNGDCMITSSTEITEPSEIEASFDITNSSCGNADGQLIVTPSGGTGMYNYDWSSGGTDSTLSSLLAGSYTVTVEDANGCQETFTTGFSDSGSPMAMVDSTISATCGELGSLFISVTGGSGSYTYAWSNGEDTEDLDEFEPGEYWLTVTDGSCMTMLQAEIPFDYPQTQEICMVTVDQTTAKNLVVWEKAVSTSISHYNIYREGFVADDYQLVGTVLYDDMSEFSDPVASPFNRSWKYKVSAVDGCGNETALSSAHKTIHATINLGLGGAINIVWDDYSGFDFSSVSINKHTTAGGWEVLAQMPTYLHSYSDTPVDLYGLWYSVTVDSPEDCIPTSSSKASGGPYYQSTSNIEDEGAIDTKVSTISDDYEISLFPNPNNGRFIIGIGESVSGTVQILDITGKSVLTENFSDTERWVNDNALEQGVYLIKFSIENEGVHLMKMIVE